MLMERVSFQKAHPCPMDFEQVFVSEGRIGCEEHYRVGRQTITAWLELCGSERLRGERSDFVTGLYRRGETRLRPIRPCPADFDKAYVQLGPKECERRYSAHWTTIRRWLNERGAERLQTARARYIGKRLSAHDVGLALSAAFPVERPNLRHSAETGS